MNIQLFQPTPGAHGFFSTESGEISGHLKFNTGVYFDYGHNLLNVSVLQPDGSKADVGAVVANRVDMNLLASLGLFGIGELGIVAPFIWQGGFDSGNFSSARVDIGTKNLAQITFGDLRLVPKIQAVNLADGLFALAVIPGLIIPTAGGTPYAGEGGLVFQPQIAMSSRYGMVRIALDAGYRLRKAAQVDSFTIDDELFGKAAVAVDLNYGGDQIFEIVGEVFGNTPSKNPFGMNSHGDQKDFDKVLSPIEGDVGIRARVAERFLVTAGIGGGFTPGYGAPSPRVFIGATFYSGFETLADIDDDGVSDSHDDCLDKSEDMDGFEDDDGCPEIDNDKDTIADDDDQCPNDAEDKDHFQDEDGCPDLDNDGDGVPDLKDACPMIPEDKDGFKDDDGCPDTDDDNDTVPDNADLCQGPAEDLDGFQDNDGCPDIDNDGDGLPDLNDLCPNNAEDKDGVSDDDGCVDDNDSDGFLDGADKCPNQAEIFNGVDDGDGCPEAEGPASLIAISDDAIVLLDNLVFKSGTALLEPRSTVVLTHAAALLKRNKQIVKVRVIGHVDSQGSRKRNQSLSEERARAVMKYLVGRGIAQARLESVGFGQDKPAARKPGERIELEIVAQKPLGVDVREKATAAPTIDIQLPEDEINEETPLLDIGGPSTPAPKTAPEDKKKKPESGVEFNFDF